MRPSIQKKIVLILLNIVPIGIMILLIPFVPNDYLLLVFYAVLIFASFSISYEEGEYVYFVFGFAVMTLSEYFFIKTGVETFTRDSLLGLMPIWLPLLWVYTFVAIKRGVILLGK